MIEETILQPVMALDRHGRRRTAVVTSSPLLWSSYRQVTRPAPLGLVAIATTATRQQHAATKQIASAAHEPSLEEEEARVVWCVGGSPSPCGPKVRPNLSLTDIYIYISMKLAQSPRAGPERIFPQKKSRLILWA